VIKLKKKEFQDLE
jgi:hypothetical protein